MYQQPQSEGTAPGTEEGSGTAEDPSVKVKDASETAEEKSEDKKDE